jgi:cytidylate kinase
MAIITISRGTFSGGNELACCLGEKLGYQVLSREVLTEAAARYGLSEAALARALEKSPTFWDRFLHERRLYLAFIQEALCEKAQQGNIVYHGHAGHLLLRGVRHVLRVRLIAPLDYRVNLVRERMHLTGDDAVHHIERVDRERARWTRFLYGVAWDDPALYDLTLNLEHLDLHAACDIVANAARQPHFQPDDASRAAMADLVLASRVRAALAANAATAHAEVDVTANAGAVMIVGKLADPRLVDDVIAGAQRVPGVTRVDYGPRLGSGDLLA